MVKGKHEAWMERAIVLGEKGKSTAPPDPWVGCVIVKHERVIAEGYSQAAGEQNGIEKALVQAGTSAEGAAVYITLEPCAEEEKGAFCLNALIQSKVDTVILAVQDPDPHMSGKGSEKLKRAKIHVVLGVKEEEARRSLAPYLHRRKTQMPYCWLKTAISLDGKIATKKGDAQGLIGPEARANELHLRAESQAILIGSGTAKSDRTHLFAQKDMDFPTKQPLCAILDAWGELPLNSPFCTHKEAQTLLYTTSAASSGKLQKMQDQGVDIVRLTPDLTGSGVDLALVLKDLASRGVLQLLIEGGSKVFSRFLERNLCQRMTLYIGSCLIGTNGVPFFQGKEIESVQQAPFFKLIYRTQLADTIRADYEKV